MRATEVQSLVPIIYFGDGPGASNYQFRPSTALAAQHDLVIVGMRGIEGSRTLDCPEVNQAFAEPAALSDAWTQAVTDAFAACMERMQGDHAELVGYGVREIVADVDRVRELLGYEHVHILADGFGAVLARLYAQLYPERVTRMVLLGPTPTATPVSQPADAERVLRAYQEACSHDSACNERAADVVSTIRELQPPDRWLVYKIDRGRLALATTLQLGYRRGALLNLGAWQDAAHGDMAGVGQVSWGTDIVLNSGFVWGAGLLQLASVAPADMVAKSMPIATQNEPLLPPATVVTALASLGLSAKSLPQFPDLPSESPAQPTLVVYGELDPRFAPATIRPAMAAELRDVSFTHVAGYGMPGELWRAAPDLLTRTITGFLDGHAAPSDIAPPYLPENALRMATMARLVVATIAAFPIVGFGIAYLLWRRVRRAVRRDAAAQHAA